MGIVRIIIGALLLVGIGNGMANDETFGALTIVPAVLFILLIVWAIVASKKAARRYAASVALEQERTQQLARVGVKATAKIKEIKKANVQVTHGQQKEIGVVLSLDVNPENCEPFSLTARGLIEELTIPQFQPGCDVHIQYLPNDTTNYSIADFRISESVTKLIIAREQRGKL